MAYDPFHPVGQQVMASSQGVVIASNQSPVSVAGTVGASIIGIPTVQTGNSSIITVAQSSVAVAIVSGSIAASFTPPANQSVSGTLGASIIGLPPVNVVGTPSISGTVNVGNLPTTQNVSGSVVSFQGTNPYIITGSIQGSFSPSGNQSVSGTVGASIIGLPPVNVVGNPSISGTVNIGNTVPVTLSGNPSISGTVNIGTIPGSIVSFQGGAWSSSVIGSVAAYQSGTWNVFVAGSVATIGTAAANQSVSGTVGASVIGLTPVAVTNTPSISGTVNIGNTVAINPVSVSGTVGASVIGLTPVAVTNTPSISGTVLIGNTNVNVSGSVAATITNTNVNISGSVAGVYTEPAVQGSVTGMALVYKNDVNASTMAAVSVKNPLPVSVQGVIGISGNPSISGTVNVGNTVTINPPSVYGNISGSVVSFQGGAWTQSVVGVVGISSIGTASGILPIAGSVAATITNTNVNVSGSVLSFLQGNASVITVAQSSVAVAIVSGSIAATFTPPANQSVSGVVGASIIGLPNVNVSGSVVGYQGTNPWIITGSVQASITPAANQSVSGTVGASIIGTAPVTQGGVWIASVFAVNQGQSAPLTSITGNPQYVSGRNQDGSVGALYVVASALQTFGSVSGTVNIAGNPSISGTVNIGTIPGSVVAFQGGAWTQSVVGVVGISSIGTLSGILPISGSVAATITNTNVNVSGSVAALLISSVYGNISGSVAAFIVGNASVITLNQSSSILAVPVGSTITVLQSPSIVGTYAEDAASANNDKGLLTLGVRNDTVASLVGADLDYTVQASDSAGRHIFKPFAAEEARLDTQTSVVSGSVTALFNSVVGLRQYVTDIMVANTGSVATLITFKDGSTSVLGYTIAPAGGGSNIIGMAMPFRTAPAQDFVFSISPSTSILYMTAKGYKAP